MVRSIRPFVTFAGLAPSMQLLKETRQKPLDYSGMGYNHSLTITVRYDAIEKWDPSRRPSVLRCKHLINENPDLPDMI